MATILDKTTSNINIFQNFVYNLGRGTIPQKITKLDLFLEARRKLKQEQEEKVKKLCQELEQLSDSIDKETVKKWIRKTSGFYKLQTYIRFVSELEHEHDRELGDIWENTKVKSYKRLYPEQYRDRKNIPVFWIYKDGHKKIFLERVRVGKVHRRIPRECNGHYTEPQEIHDRNYAIAVIRDKYLAKSKRGPKGYERQANYYYESPEAYRAFLREVEQKGLVREKTPSEIKRLDTSTKHLFELGLIKGTNTEGLDEDDFYSFKDLNRFQKEEIPD